MKKRLITLLAVLSFAASQFAPAVYAVNKEQSDIFTDETAADNGNLAAGETEDVVMEEPAEEKPEVFADEALPEEDDEEAELMVETSGTCGDNVTWVLDSSGTLTISGTGAMADYGNPSSNNTPWFSNRRSIKNIIIEDGVTSIGDSAFSRCSSLSSIGIPTSVTSIGDSAFNECRSLSSISIPDSVTSIGASAFNVCRSLSSISIPDSVTSIGDSAFKYCSSLTQIDVDNENLSYSSVNGVLFDRNKETIIAYPAGKTDTSYAIPTSVTSIGNRAFERCDSLSSISIPTSVTSIGNRAFERCDSLSSINIPTSVTSIGDSAFYLCSSLSSISIPSSVTSIGDSAFEMCDSLSSISIPSSVTSIGNSVFSYCSSLSSISIPNSVTSIGSYAFEDCISLSSIRIPTSVTRIGNGAFYLCSSLSSISIPSSVTSIGRYAFDDCSSLKTVNYFGRSTQWSNISIDINNDPLTNATKYYLLDDDIFTLPTQSADSYNITDSSEYHYWEFKPEQSGTYIFKTTTENAVIRLYDADLNPIGSEAENNAEIIFDANKDKSFYLAVRRKNGGDTGTIDVQLTRRYNISYNANGGSFTPESQTVKYGEKLKISSSTPSREGYIFCGWAVSSNASAAEYMPGAEVEFDNDYMLYAVWKKETTDGGTIPELPESDIKLIYQDGTVTLSGTTRIKSGTVLAEAIYDNGKFVSVKTYPVTSNDAEIKVSGGKGTKKYMLWESLSSMKKLADPVTAD